MMPRFIQTQVRIVLLAAIGLLLASPVLRAADVVPAKAADTDKPAKAEKADKKAAKAKKDDVAPAKEKPAPAPSGLPVGVTEDTVKKAYPELFKMKEKLLTMGADIRALKAAETTKDKKKADKELPKLEKKFKTLLDRLTKDYEKQLKPVDDEKQTLVTQDAELSTKISEAESAGKKTDKLTTLKNDLTKRLEANEQKATLLHWLTSIPPIDDK